MDGPMNECTNGRVDGRMDRWMDGWTVDGWTDGWTDRQIDYGNWVHGRMDVDGWMGGQIEAPVSRLPVSMEQWTRIQQWTQNKLTAAGRLCIRYLFPPWDSHL